MHFPSPPAPPGTCKLPPCSSTPVLTRLSFSYYNTGSGLDKVRDAVFMFSDLFGLERFGHSVLVQFLITVQASINNSSYNS